MLSSKKLNEICQERKVGTEQLAEHLARAGFDKVKGISAVKNWPARGLLKPSPKQADVERLAHALSVQVNDISQWCSSYKYAPGSARKARLVTSLIAGRGVQDALDLLRFTGKRAAKMVEGVLKSAIANADEHEAEVDNLYVSSAWVDDAGVRIGTKRWIPKDRGRAHPIRKKACHIHVTVSQV